MRAVTNESGKWRSGREAVRTGRTLPSGRGGKTPHAFAEDECVAAQDTRDVVVPAGIAASFVVVQSQFALEILVEPFGAVALLDDAHKALAGGLAGQRREEVIGRLQLVARPLDQKP